MLKKTNLLMLTGVTAVVVGAMLTIFGFRMQQDNVAAPPVNEELVARGEIVYEQHCASCHGKNLEGQPDWKSRDDRGRLPAPPHDETGHTWHHADQLIFELTKYGMVPPNIPEGYESDMPAFENVLTDKDIWAVIYFIKSRWPEEIRNRQQQMSG